MSQTQEMTLPSGKKIIIDELPKGMTQTRLQEILTRNNLATAEDFITPEVVPTEDPSMMENIGQFLQENIDIPAGIAGAIAGAKLTAPTLNPWVVGAAAVGGGAIGTFGGSLASDVLTGQDLEYQEAVEKALTSAAFDVATLGAVRLLKGSYVLGKKALGHTPQETAESIIKKAKEGMEAGSRESLQATQNILTERGASLSRSQTGQASALAVMAEKLGQSGLLSETATLRKVADVNNALRGSLDDIVNKIPMRSGESPREIGEAMYDTISAGRLALSDAYGESLGVITESLSNKVVNTGPIRSRLAKYLKDNRIITKGVQDVVPSGSPFASKSSKTRVVTSTKPSLDDATVKFINSKMTGILKLPNMKASDVIAMDRMLSSEIRKFGDINSSLYNTTAQKELNDVVDILKDSFINTVKQADTNAATNYARLKTDYKLARDTLLPKITTSVIKKADGNDYDALGKMLTSQTNSSKVREFMKSIDESYAQLGRRNNLPFEIPYSNAEEAKQAIKQGFLKDIFDDVSSDAFNISKYSNLAAKYSKPANADMLKAVTGKDYLKVKQLMNAMSEASQNPDGNLGTLFLRGKEYGAVGQVSQETAGIVKGGTVVAAGNAAGPLGAVVGLGVILATPVFLAKAAFNPKVVNRMLAFDKATFKTPAAKEKAMAVIIDDLVRGMDEYEAATFRKDIQIAVDGQQ